jgi:DNA-binding CsgD family transcriptional regulator
MATTIDLDRFLTQLDATSARDDLQKVTVDLRDQLGVDHVVYHWVDSAGDQYGCGTYSRKWVAHYVARNYLRTDPVIIGCFQRFHPVDWKRLDWSSKPAREFLADALVHGVGNQGYSVPIRGPAGQFALFTASHNSDDSTWESIISRIGRDLILIAHFINRKALEFEPKRQGDASLTLSPREVDAMTLLAVGYSRAQVADTLSISEHTLRVYIESARFKLGAQNTTHAVARAIGCGLIVV